MSVELIKSKIRSIPDFPKPGIIFRDITTLFADPEGFKLTLDNLETRYKKINFDAIVAIESRGFIIGASLADRLNKSFVPIRKKGKLPAEIESLEYNLEYGTDIVEIHKDAFQKDSKILMIDDLLATGGTMFAANQLVEKLGGKVIECAFVIDLPDIGGRDKLIKNGYKVYNIVRF